MRIMIVVRRPGRALSVHYLEVNPQVVWDALARSRSPHFGLRLSSR